MSTPQERREVYSTPRWHRLRSRKLNKNPLCERCQSEGFTVGAKMVHHVVPIRDGGPAFPKLDGLMSLCWPCHRGEHRDQLPGERQNFYEIFKGLE